MFLVVSFLSDGAIAYPTYRAVGTNDLPDIDWVTIPSGDFKMGSDAKDKKAYGQEQPAHPVPINAFKISRYPITNAQYRCFVEAGGYNDTALWGQLPQAARWWHEGGEADQKLLDSITEKDTRERYKNWLADDTARHEPRYWNDPKWNLDNHPVVGISWFEALAFMAWLNDQDEMISNEVMLPNNEIRLPTEEEWEYAARGSDNLKYAWGDKVDKTKGNYNETGLSQTSPVGMFPKSDAFDLYDMSGNVWEWTSSRWGNDSSSPLFKYKDWEQEKELAKRNDLNPTEFRITRGGSWLNTSINVRCAFRYWYLPNLRFSNIGFRVVCS